MKWLAANRYNAVDMLGIYVIGKLVPQHGVVALIYLPMFMALSYIVEKAARER